VYKALRNEEVLLYDDGGMTRCFTYIDDIIRGLVDPRKTRRGRGRPSTGQLKEVTIKEVVETVSRCREQGGLQTSTRRRIRRSIRGYRRGFEGSSRP
jgi:UDP-glucose 4-epimerase